MATSAVQEGVLEEMMEKVSAMWAKTEFEVSVSYVGPGEVVRLLSQSRAAILAGSPFATSFTKWKKP